MKGRFHSYLNSAEKIITLFNGGLPLAIFLKDFFKKDSKFGSRDRKTISSLCYSYYRVGKSIHVPELSQKLTIAYFLCAESGNELLADLGTEWNDFASKGLDDKLEFLQKQNLHISLDEIFPCRIYLGKNLLGHEMDFIHSHLHQSDLFLRIRPGKEQLIHNTIKKNKLNCVIEGSTLRLPIGTNLSKFFNIDQDVIIQDLSSQQTGSIVSKALKILSDRGDQPKIWDSCAASGGKSLLAFDLDPNIYLAVSDIRKSIIENLITRFSKAGIKEYKYFIQDLTKPLPDLKAFNFIIADVPCSGSGTWGRTPEEMFFFKDEMLQDYAKNQKAIMNNILASICPGTLLLYITCSVFKLENEAITEFICQYLKLELLEEQYFNGYMQNADTMYAALFIARG